MYRLLALDMDGTMLNSRKELTPRTERALLELRQRGWLITLISGRRPQSMLPFAERLRIDIPFASLNGALLIDPEKLDILERIALPASARELMQRWFDEGLCVQAYSDALSGTEFCYLCDDQHPVLQQDFAQRDLQRGWAKHVRHPELLDFEPLRIMVGGRQADTERAKELAAPWLQTGEVWAMHSRDYDGLWFLEIFPRQATKGTALAKICHRLAIPLAEVVAAGDQVNDIDMIQEVGLGIAMGNAVADLKKVAQRIIGSHDEDGLALFLEEML